MIDGLHLKVSEVCRPLDKQLEELRVKYREDSIALRMAFEASIAPIKSKVENLMHETIMDALDLHPGDKLFYECKGSGYYGIFKGYRDNKIVMDVHSKGWVNKNYEFVTPIDCFYYFTKLKN